MNGTPTVATLRSKKRSGGQLLHHCLPLAPGNRSHVVALQRIHHRRRHIALRVVQDGVGSGLGSPYLSGVEPGEGRCQSTLDVEANKEFYSTPKQARGRKRARLMTSSPRKEDEDSDWPCYPFVVIDILKLLRSCGSIVAAIPAVSSYQLSYLFY